MKITVVMPTHNRARFIAEAIESLVGQTHPPHEIVVIDDGSTDDTKAIVEGLGGRAPIHYLRNDTPRGASVSRNRGVEEASGDVIVFLDSDDVLEPQHHRRALEVFRKHADVALFCNDCLMIGPEGEWLSEKVSWTEVQCRIKGVSIDTGRRTLGDIFLFPTAFPGMTLRRDVYRELGGLDQSIFPLDDYDLQLRVAASGRSVYYAHTPLARYRIHGGNESGQGRAVRVGEKKILCLERIVASHPAVIAELSGARVRERFGELRRELAVSRLRAGQPFRGMKELAAATIGVPNGMAELGSLARRALKRRLGTGTSTGTGTKIA